MKPRQQFLNNLDEITSNIYEMASEVENRIQRLIQLTENRNADALNQIIKEDTVINDIEILLNEKVISLITLEAPVASDLRMLISYIKIAEDLERVGDNVVNISRILTKFSLDSLEIQNKVISMLKLSELMLIDVVTAMKNKDLTLVREIMTRDDDIDAIYLEITSSSVFEIEDKLLMSQVFLITKHIERMGDHIENIGEHLYFYLTGRQYQ